jgi:hypothetical protein
MPQQFNNPQEIAKAGQEIYERKYRANYEPVYSGQFVVIDVKSEEVFVAPHPEEAIKKARLKSPTGIFHLIKVGSPGAYKVSYSLNVRRQWIFRERQPSS